MMDFLRRLAPPRESDATRAVAEMRSRFASDPPLRSAVPMTLARQVEAGDGLPPSRGEAEATGARPAPDPEWHDRSAGAPPAPTSGPPEWPNPARAPAAHQNQREDIAPRPATFAVASAAHVESAARGGFTRAPDAAQAPGGGARVAHAGAAPPPSVRSLATPLMAAAPSAPPLSDGAVAARTSQRTEPEAVVQVTIGRIEVTAQGPPTAARAARPQRAPGSVSLADYLHDGSGRRP